MLSLKHKAMAVASKERHDKIENRCAAVMEMIRTLQEGQLKEPGDLGKTIPRFSTETQELINSTLHNLEYEIVLAEDDLESAEAELMATKAELRKVIAACEMDSDEPNHLEIVQQMIERIVNATKLAKGPKATAVTNSDSMSNLEKRISWLETDDDLMSGLERRLADMEFNHKISVKQKAKIEILQQDIQEAQNRAEEALGKVEEAEARVKEADRIARDAVKEAQSAEAKIRQAQDKTQAAKQQAENAAQDALRNVQDAEARMSKAQQDASASKRQTEQAIKEAENARKQAAFAKLAETARTGELNALQTTYDETVALGKKQRLEDEERLAKMQQDLFYAQDNARKNFDEIQDLKGNLRVMCRIRPQLKAAHTELENFKLDVGPDSGHLQLLSISKRQSPEVDSFQMERIFDKNESNDQIFSEVSQLVRSAINGRNVCIFAYGQTGSGKTHTMTYPWNEDNKIAASGAVDEGIIPRTVRMISNAISETKDSWTFTVKGRFIEIYMDHVYDLLRNETGPIQDIPVKYATERRNGKDENIYKAESNEVELTTLCGDFHEAKVREMLLQAAKSRHTRATGKNAQSSRSHSILSLKIEGERVDMSSGKITETCGTLNLIDLAGSEKPTDSSLDKESQAEGTKINKSLLVLRNVLEAMANPKAAQVPFRESTLTKLLQPSLGEGCRTLMFVMVSPLTKDREETRNTLSFAKVAQNAKLRTLRLEPETPVRPIGKPAIPPRQARQPGQASRSLYRPLQPRSVTPTPAPKKKEEDKNGKQ